LFVLGISFWTGATYGIGNRDPVIGDPVIGARNEHQFAKIRDIYMLVFLHGKERTHAEWKELLHAAGFQLTRVVPIPSFAHVVEAVRIKYRAG